MSETWQLRLFIGVPPVSRAIEKRVEWLPFWVETSVSFAAKQKRRPYAADGDGSRDGPYGISPSNRVVQPRRSHSHLEPHFVKTEPLARLGLRAAASLEEAVRESGVVILILSNYTIAQQLLQAPGVVAALPGKLLVQLTTGTPQEARRMESWANGLRIAYLEGAIMSYPSGIGQPQCTIFYSGSKEVFDRIRPVLMLLGGNTTYVGSSVGHASALDIAGLSFVLGAMFGFVSGHIVCVEEGISGKAFVESVRNLLPAVEGILAGVSDTIQSRGYAGYEATIDAWSVGPRELIEWCDGRGIRHDVANAQQNLFDEAIKRGHGEADFAYLYEIMRKGRTAEPVSA